MKCQMCNEEIERIPEGWCHSLSGDEQCEGATRSEEVATPSESESAEVNTRPDWHAVAAGEVFDAINFYGPFDGFDEAEVWADRNVGSSNAWWIIKLEENR